MTGVSVAAEVATERSGRAVRVGMWVALAITIALVAVWLVAAKNPSLESAGMSWQSTAFVQQDPSEAADDDQPTWIAWNQEDGAWASVVVTNDRPYAVSIAPGADLPGTTVQVATYDPNSPIEKIAVDTVGEVPHLRLAPGDSAVVLMHVIDRCVHLTAGSSIGNDTAPVDVTTFGVTTSLDVPFPATYMAGSTADHVADPSCGTR